MHKPPLPPFLAEGMVHQILQTSHALGMELRQRASIHGMNRTWGMILGHLAVNPDGLTATDLRQCIGVTAASISKALADMEREQLVERTPNPADARSMLVHLTEEGQQMLAFFPQTMLEVEQLAFAGVAEKEREVLRDILARICANLGDSERQDLSVSLDKEDRCIG